jgi:hypothetical protein
MMRHASFAAFLSAAIAVLPDAGFAFSTDCRGSAPAACRFGFHNFCSQFGLCSGSAIYCTKWTCVPDVVPQCPADYAYTSGNCCDTGTGTACFVPGTPAPRPPTYFSGCPNGYNYDSAGLCCDLYHQVCFDYQGCATGHYDIATGKC